MDPSPSPTDITWDDAQPPSATPQGPTAAPAPQGADAPKPMGVIWNPPTKDTWGEGEEAGSLQEDRYHTLKAVARGFVGTLGEMTGDTTEQIAGRNKTLGIDDPNASSDDKMAQMAGGMMAPSPVAAGAGAMAAARAVDKDLGTLGQQTGSRFVQMAEKGLAMLPGGGSLINSLKTQTARVEQTSEDIIHNLSGGADSSATGAGQQLKGQLGKAAQRMKDDAATHFDEVSKYIPPGSAVPVHNTLGTLTELTSPVAGAEGASATLVNPKLKAIREGLEADLKASGSASLPYEVLKKLRTKIGGQIEWGPFSTDTANGQLKQVYASLTADMNNGAASISPKAAEAVRSANSAYAASKEQGKVLKAVMDRAGGPEKVFTSLMSGTRDGATTIKQVLGAVDQPTRDLLAASALQRMGRATPGAQDAAGQVFSADTFLTNWNRMAPEARDALFGHLPGEYSKSVTQLAQNIERLKAYAKVMPNPSGTAQASMWAGWLGSGMTALLTNNPILAAKIAALPIGNKLLSTALTNPQTVKWLAKETSRLVPPAAQAAAGEQVPSGATLQ